MPLINRRKKQATGRNDFLLFWIPLINRRKKQAAWRNDFCVVLDTSYCFCHANRRKKQATGRDDVRRLGSVRSPNPTRICKIPIQRRQAGRHTNLKSEKQRNIEATELSSISRSCSDLFTSFPLHFDLLIGANSRSLARLSPSR